MDRPLDPMARDDDWDGGPDNEWGHELFESGGVEEPTADKRVAERESITAHVAAEDIYDHDTQMYLAFLSVAVQRLGGTMVITPEDRLGRWKLGIDQTGLRDGTGVLRLFSFEQGA